MGRWSQALIVQVDRRTQQFHWYLLIDLIIVRWSAAHRGLPGSLISTTMTIMLTFQIKHTSKAEMLELSFANSTTSCLISFFESILQLTEMVQLSLKSKICMHYT